MLFDDPAPSDDRPRRPRGWWAVRAIVVLALLGGAAYFLTSDDIYGKVRRGPDAAGRGRMPRRESRSAVRYNAPQAGARLTPDQVARYGSEHVYDTGTLRTIFLQFEQEQWERELSSRYGSDADVPATLDVDGVRYRDVGVRFRGNSSYRMVPAGLKRSFNLSLDAVHPDQQVGGYRTLNLLNSNGDPTFVRAVLYSEIARHYLPTPRVNFVRVVINGESWGIYLNAQQFNKDFLRDFYGTTKGARWKVPGSPRGRAGLEYLGDGPEAYKGLYEIKSKDDDTSWSDLVRLCRLLNTTPADKLEAVLAPHLDVDGVLKFLALDVALVNTDGYWTRASDYSIFQDDRGRFHILPYDFNEAMGVQGGRRGGQGSGPTVDPLIGLDDISKPLRSKLLAVPALRARYLAYVRNIAEEWMDWTKLSPLVRRYQTLIASDVKADGRKLYGLDAFDPAPLQRFFEQRRAFLLQSEEGNHD